MSKIMSKELTVKVNQLLKPIANKKLRNILKKQCNEMVGAGVSDRAVLNNVKTDVFSYRYKMADYPHLRAAFESVMSEAFGGVRVWRLDEFGYHASLVERTHWCVFVFAALLSGSVASTMQPENRNQNDR